MSDRAVYKSATVEALDAYFSGSPEELRSIYEYTLEVLEQNQSLSAIMKQLQDDGRQRREFVPAARDSPLVGKAFEEVTRRGYSEAMHLALSHREPVPIETLWMTGACDDFEMHVADGDRQVTVLVLIPQARDYGSKRAGATSWVVGAGSDGEARQTSGRDAAARPSARRAR